MQVEQMGLTKWYSWRGALCRRTLASQWNVEGGLNRMIFFSLGWLSFVALHSLLAFLDGWVDGWDVVLG